MRLLLTLLIFAGSALAQEFVLIREEVLSGATAVVTVQQPAANGRRVNFRSAWIDTTADIVVTIERNGTAASATSTTPAPLNPPGTSTALGYYASNVGVGTVVSKFACKADSICTVDLSRLVMSGSGTGKNLTIRIASTTATVHIGIAWAESVL